MNFMVIGAFAILAICIVVGHIKGIIGELTSVVALVLSIAGMALFVVLIDHSLDREFGDALMAGVFLLVFIILVQLIKVLIGAIKIFSKLPIINGMNKLLGTILGIVEGLLIVWMLIIVLGQYNINGKSAEYIAMLDENSFTAFLARINPLVHLFK